MKKEGKKLIVMIPCLNEEKTLPQVIKSIPKKISGIAKIETLVIDDGSTDKTAQVAKELGVDHFIIHKKNFGLARAFASGMDKALELGADIIVNTDGDNQYPQEDIPKLVKPILNGEAELVIGDRQPSKIKEFSWYKRLLQKVGSHIVSNFAGIHITDAVSGFRARSRDAALKTNIFSDYSYVLETLIQAGKKKIAIKTVTVKIRPRTRKSRLIKNLWSYLKISAATAIRIYTVYEPLKIFSYIGIAIAFVGTVLVFRFLYFFTIGSSGGHVQSLIIAAILILIGFQIFLIGIVADLIGMNRKLIEEILYRIKKKDYDRN